MEEIDYHESIIRKKLKEQLENELSNLQYTRESHLKASHRLDTTADMLGKAQIVISALSTGGIVSLFLNDTIVAKIIGAACSAFLFAISMYIKDKNLTEESEKHRKTANKLWGLREKYHLLLSTLESKSVKDIEDSIKVFVSETQTIYDESPGFTENDYAKANAKINKGSLKVTVGDKKNTVPTHWSD